MTAPLILWFRRDLRLDDNPMLAAAAATGRPLVPVFIADDSVMSLGAAAKWRMGEAIGAFAQRLHWHCHFMQKTGPLNVKTSISMGTANS